MGKLITITIAIMIFLLGWVSHIGYLDINNERFLNGIWIPEAESQQEALRTAAEFDGDGNWVCINTKGMNFKKLVSSCTHEAGHEIFARMAQENPNLIEKLENYTK